MYSVEKKTNKITLTRGDTLKCKINLFYSDGSPYVPAAGDKCRFALKKVYTDANYIILKSIPTATMILQLDPNDTKPLDFGTYTYDIEMTFDDGTVYTFVTPSPFIIDKEVY